MRGLFQHYRPILEEHIKVRGCPWQHDGARSRRMEVARA
jgi:hypothetical protein